MIEEVRKTNIDDYKKKMDQYGYNEVEKRQAVDDLNSGLMTNQVEKYLGKGYDLRQMRVMSVCMKKAYSEEVSSVICNPTYNGFQMEVALEYYEKGIPIEQIGEFRDGKKDSVSMRKTYQRTLLEMQKLIELKEGQPEYVAKLVEGIDSVVKRIEATDKKYDLLVDKVAHIGKEDKEVIDGLLKNLKNKDQQIVEMASQIIKAKEEILSLQATIHNLAIEKEKETVENKQEYVTEEAISSSKMPFPMYYGIPVSYETIVKASNQIQMLPIERATKRTSGALLRFATALGIKKKYKQNLVKLIVSKDLSSDQLLWLRVAMQKGLTEKQMMELINNKVSAEQMKEIIEFAVLENSMK
jgi:hypothetical protein